MDYCLITRWQIKEHKRDIENRKKLTLSSNFIYLQACTMFYVSGKLCLLIYEIKLPNCMIIHNVTLNKLAVLYI